MNTVEKALLAIIKKQKEQQEQLDYLVEAVELLVQIQTENIKNNQKK